MRISTVSKLCLGGLAVPMLLAPPSANAQATQPTPSDTSALPQDIIVTAQKRSESVNKVPLSIQAFSGSDLKKAGITDPSGLTQVVPGFNFSKSSANTPIYTVRGIGFNTPNLSSTSPVGIYVDEVAYAYPYMSSGPIFDLSRVEILKGPQGTLYGRNTTGGLVNFITAKPTRQFEAGITAEVGNYRTYNFEGYISGPLTDTLAFRLSGRDENSDEGWQRSLTRPGDRLGKKDRLAGRAMLDWAPTSRLHFLLTASYWRDKSDTVAQQAVAIAPDAPAFVPAGLPAAIQQDWAAGSADWDTPSSGRPPYKSNSRFAAVSLRADYDLTDTIKFTSLTAYNDVKRHDMNDADGTAFESSEYLSDGRIKSFSQEIRLSGTGPKADWIVGAYYAHDDIRDDQVGYFTDASVLNELAYLGQLAPNPRYTPSQIANGFNEFRNTTSQVSKTASVFANGNYAISQTLKLGAGIRYTRDNLSFAGCSRDYNNNTAPVWNTGVAEVVSLVSGKPYVDPMVGPNQCLTFRADFSGIDPINTDRLKEDNVAGKVSITWTPTNRILAYASISRGFKSGAFPDIAANIVTQLAPAKQEEVTAYEIGLKAGLFNRMIQANFSTFYYDYRNKQLFGEILDPIFLALQRIVNVPKSQVYGGEAEITFRPSSALQFQVGASYTHTEVTEYVGYNRLAQLKDFRGSEFPYTPKVQINALASYDLPLSSRLGLQATANGNYQGPSTGAIGGEPAFAVRSYTVVNADIALHALNDRWRVGLYARNLFNENYYTAVEKIGDVISRVPGMTRTFGIRLSYKLM